MGVSLDPQAAAFVLDAAQPGERVQLPAETIYPTLTTVLTVSPLTYVAASPKPRSLVRLPTTLL